MSVPFTTLPLHPALLEVLAEVGLHTMTKIQAAAIPLLLQGKDVMGQSQTGSGKTATFALPILQNLKMDMPRIQALVLCPTRELCAQVAREFRRLGRKLSGLHVVVLVGGEPSFRQRAKLEQGAHIAVATPGRLLDHLYRHAVDLNDINCVVVDEADRMFEMGFDEQVDEIIKRLPDDRQTVLFSATYPRNIQNMAESYLRDPSHITVEDIAENAPDIEQYTHTVDTAGRIPALLQVLAQLNPDSTLVFCNQRLTVDDVVRALTDNGVSSAGLHGDMEQPERDRVMARFRNRSLRVLVATDVAARGLDIADLDLVVNLDAPPKPELYVHRIGRTGRAGKKGSAITFVSSRESARVNAIEKEIGQTLKLWQAAAPTDSATNAQAKPALPQDARMETLYISGGRKDKVRPGDILGALTGEAGGLQSADIGKIEIHDRFSYVAVSKHIAERALKSLSEGKIKGKKFRVSFSR